METPFTKKTILINSTHTQLLCESRLAADSSGKTYSGNVNYRIPANGIKVISSNVFTNETVQQMKHLQIHVTSDGLNPKILHIDDIEDNKIIIFLIQSDGDIGTRFVSREETERCKFNFLRCLFPFWGREDDVATLLDLHV